MRHPRAARRLPPSPAEKAPFHGHLRNHVTFFAQPRKRFRCRTEPVGPRDSETAADTTKCTGRVFGKLGFPVCALCCKTRRMSDSNVVIRKKRGRPRTGQDPVLSFRWGLDFKEAIDRWRAR